MNRLKFLILVVCGFVAMSCDTQDEFSSRRCHFVFDNATHQDPMLAAAMTPHSGVFTTVTLTMHGGARYFRFTTNQNTSSEAIFNAIDRGITLLLGMNDGLIVGYGSPPDLSFYAYDRECPNCYDDSRVPIHSYPLQTTSSGMAVCTTCHREYDMNYGGHIVKGDHGNKLERYRGSTTGPYGKLSVIN